MEQYTPKIEKTRTAAEILGKYPMRAGQKIAFIKTEKMAESSVSVGARLEGVLARDVAIGEPITFANSEAHTSVVQMVRERDGTLEVKTATSVYRLSAEQKTAAPEKITFEEIARVITAKGSEYTYLADGTTQRFKKVAAEINEPQQLLVYVPDYEWVQKYAPKEILQKFGENETMYEQIILEHVHSLAGKKVYMQNSAGEKLDTNDAIRSSKSTPMLGFYRNGTIEFAIPISHTPKIGWSTYDQRYYIDPSDGESMREKHLGNKVVRIVLKDGRVVE